MPMEQEVMGLLIGGFVVVMAISFLVVLVLWLKHRKPVYGWFVAHLVTLSLGIIYWLIAVQSSRGPQTAMASEDNSVRIAMAGIFWAISMGCMLTGVSKMNPK